MFSVGRAVSAAALVGHQGDVERPGDLRRDVGLEREDLRDLPLVVVRPDLRVVGDADQARRDAHAARVPGAVPADGALEDVVGVQLAADLAGGLARALVDARAGAGDHAQSGDQRQPRRDLVGDAVREVLVVGVAEVLERERRDDPAVRRRLPVHAPVERIPQDEQGGRDGEQQRPADDRGGARHGGSLRWLAGPGSSRPGERPRAHPRERRVRDSRRQLELQRPELVEDVTGRLVPVARVLLEAPPDHAFQLLRQLGPDLRHGRRLVLQHGRQELDRVHAAERTLSGRDLEQHHAEGEDVGALVHLLAARLLGGHVVRRADDQALPRRGEGLESRGRDVVARHGQLGQAEVEHLDPASLVGDHHVARLQVAVHDPRGVGGGERVGDRDGQVEEPLERGALFRITLSSVRPSISSIVRK